MNQRNSFADELQTPESIREMIFSFQSSRVLLTAYELGVFSVLADDRKSSQKVAEQLRADARATDRLLNALVALGLLRKTESQFSNTALTSRFLVKGKPEYLAGLMHAVNLWDMWSTLTEAVHRGTSVPPHHKSEGAENWLVPFIAAMHERAIKQAPATVTLLDLSGVKNVLDVGGGSGAFSMSFVQAKDGIRATVFDLPDVIPLTRNYIQQAGLAHKIDTTAGDYLIDDLGSGYDLVFLSAIVHSNSPEENQMLLRKCAQASNSGGQVVVQDFIMDESRTIPAHGALFALNMLVATEAGDTFTETEVQSWLEEAGFTDIFRNDTPFGVSQMIGRKK